MRGKLSGIAAAAAVAPVLAAMIAVPVTGASASTSQWRNVESRGWIQANGTGKQLSTSTAAKRPAAAFWAWNTPAKAQG